MSQLLRSLLGVFWLLIPALHVDNIRALTQLVLESPASCIPALQKLLNSQPASSDLPAMRLALLTSTRRLQLEGTCFCQVSHTCVQF